MDVYLTDRILVGNKALTKTQRAFREFFPKGPDFTQVSDVKLQYALHPINNWPCKCLGWKSTNASFQEELLHLD
ncbi:hypothetical protein GCM10010969_21200 [Saccharibacillus kuerlensis]|uniref:DUF4817 domain-containing protein n=1 Tax=Saccharibacillus kuerlensis TaxID=459527 RepID=A0ABQ2L2P1_9BACL|nr:hypothetical protein GCM10010969_21200 [Saccharibacillus kuerlensis]